MATMLSGVMGTLAMPIYAVTSPNTGRAQLVWYQWIASQVDGFEQELLKQDEQQLRRRSLALRYRAKTGEPLNRLLPEAYALMRETCRRKFGMRHYPVQVWGGIALHYRSIVEMQTGEGKTLTATLPLYLNALLGKGVLLATSNDYLAKRDAEELGPAYELLGLSVGCIQAQMPTPARAQAYAADITYGTAKEFGFDFLRDQLLLRRIREGQSDVVGKMLGQGQQHGDKPVQRAPHFIVIDEADSLMIDEARTPLIISALPGEAEKMMVASYKWAAEVAGQFTEPELYTYDFTKRTIELTAEGRRIARTMPKPELMNSVPVQAIYEYVERAIRAERDFKRDQQYIVRDDEIVIVDEFTGRLGEGRKWRDGLHQAIEAKEGVKIGVDSGQAARVTVQDFFSRFPKLAGMTGTASDAAREFRKVFKSQVVVIPTNRPSLRRRETTRIYGTAAMKWEAIVQDIREVNASGRPILVGTRNIDQSELLSSLLKQAGIEHEVLNARQLAKEAEIVKEAGQQGKVTVSTNMAGRGTDIKLGSGIAELGGLYVIAAEMHDAARIDRQLIGRCARQGDPGSFRVYLSLEDEIIRSAWGPKAAKRYAKRGQQQPGQLPVVWLRFFKRSQRKIENKHFRDRKILLYYEKERKKAQIQMGQDPYLDTPY